MLLNNFNLPHIQPTTFTCDYTFHARGECELEEREEVGEGEEDEDGTGTTHDASVLQQRKEGVLQLCREKRGGSVCVQQGMCVGRKRMRSDH